MVPDVVTLYVGAALATNVAQASDSLPVIPVETGMTEGHVPEKAKTGVRLKDFSLRLK